jgi:PKD repeat protein
VNDAAAGEGSLIVASSTGGTPAFDTRSCGLGFHPSPMSWYPTDPTVGQVVSFTPLHLNADGWEWRFADGDVMTGMLPGHSFRNEGPAVVTLTVTSGDTTDTFVETIEVSQAKPRRPSGRTSPTPLPEHSAHAQGCAHTISD